MEQFKLLNSIPDGDAQTVFLASPVVGTIWYVQTMKEISSTIKEKRAERAADKPDVFDI